MPAAVTAGWAAMNIEANFAADGHWAHPCLSPVDETRFPTDSAASWRPRHVVRAIQIRLPSPVEGPPDPPGRRKDRIYAEHSPKSIRLGVDAGNVTGWLPAARIASVAVRRRLVQSHCQLRRLPTMMAALWVPALAKAVSTAMVVVVASALAEAIGPFWGALIASLPVSAGPAYVFLAMQHDAAFVAASALSSCAANAATGLFLIVYATTARRLRLWQGLGAALATWLVASVLMRQIAWTPATVVLLNLAVYGAGFLMLERHGRNPAPTSHRPPCGAGSTCRFGPLPSLCSSPAWLSPVRCSVHRRPASRPCSRSASPASSSSCARASAVRRRRCWRQQRCARCWDSAWRCWPCILPSTHGAWARRCSPGCLCRSSWSGGLLVLRGRSRAG